MCVCVVFLGDYPPSICVNRWPGLIHILPAPLRTEPSRVAPRERERGGPSLEAGSSPIHSAVTGAGEELAGQHVDRRHLAQKRPPDSWTDPAD